MPEETMAKILSKHPALQQMQIVRADIDTKDALEAFLASEVWWCAVDVRINPIDGDVVLRHQPFARVPLQPGETLLTLDTALDRLRYRHKNIKLNVMTGGPTVPRVLKRLSNYGFNRLNTWFNGNVEHLQAEGFREIRQAHPGAIVQCPVDFLASLLLDDLDQARKILERVTSWGVNRFALGWDTPHCQHHFEQMTDWGYEIDLYNIPDMAALLEAAQLNPQSLTLTFDIEQPGQQQPLNGRASDVI